MPRERLVEELKQEKVLLLDKYHDLALRINNQAGADLADNVYLGRLINTFDGTNVMIDGVNWGEVSREDRMSFSGLVGPMVVANPYHRVCVGAIRAMPVRELIALPKGGIEVAGFLKLAVEEDLGFDYQRLMQSGEVEALMEVGRIPRFNCVSSGYYQEKQAIECIIPPRGSVPQDENSFRRLGFVDTNNRPLGVGRRIQLSLQQGGSMQEEVEALKQELYPEIYYQDHPWQKRARAAKELWDNLTRKY